VPAERLAALQNPQVLLAPETTAQIQQSFAALGPQGPALFQQLMAAIRDSLAGAITGLFVIAAGAMVVGFGVSLFLQEIPLRKSRGAAHATPAIEGIEGGLLDEVVADLADVGEDFIPVDGVAAVVGAPHEDPGAPIPVGATGAGVRWRPGCRLRVPTWSAGTGSR